MKTNIDLNSDPLLADIVAKRAASVFEERYPNLLACFDVGGVFGALAAALRLDGGPTGTDFTVPNIVARTEEILKQLLLRGALNQFQLVPPPIPPAAQIELDNLFGIEEQDTVAQEQAAQASERKAQVQYCAKDWRNLPTADFKRKWPARIHQAIIEEAWAWLEAQDKSTADGYKIQRESREREANSVIRSTPLSTRDF